MRNAIPIFVALAFFMLTGCTESNTESANPAVRQVTDAVPSPIAESSTPIAESSTPMAQVTETAEPLDFRFAHQCTTRHYRSPDGFIIGDNSMSFGACSGDASTAEVGSELDPSNYAIRLVVREQSTLTETMASLASDRRWESVSETERKVDGRRIGRLEGSLRRADGSLAEVVIDAIDLDEATLSIIAVDDAPDSQRWPHELPFADIRSVQAALLDEIEVFAVVCGVPQSYHSIDFNGDGNPEWLGTALRQGRMHRVEVLQPTLGESCVYTTAAEGTSFGSAGSPQGFGCSGLSPDRTFVDWAASGGAFLSPDGGETAFYMVEFTRTTRFGSSHSATENATMLRVPRAIETGDFMYPCFFGEVVDGFTSRGTAQSVSAPVARCRNDHWLLDVPGNVEWFTHDLPQSFIQKGSDRRCTYFTRSARSISLQCDCVAAVTITYREHVGEDSARNDGITIVSETETLVDGYPATLTRLEDEDVADLFGEHTRYTYTVDVGQGELTIEASDAEFDNLDQAIELADQIANTIEIRNIAPADRLCAAVPEHHDTFPVIYHDFDGDGVSEAIVADEPIIGVDPIRVELTHRVWRADSQCGWLMMVGPSPLVQNGATDGGRSSWHCAGDGHLVTVASDGQETHWTFDGTAFFEHSALAENPTVLGACGNNGR